MLDLTPKQQVVLAFIREFVHERGRTPSIREVQQAMGLSAVSSSMQHIKALRLKGYLKKERHIALEAVTSGT